MLFVCLEKLQVMNCHSVKSGVYGLLCVLIVISFEQLVPGQTDTVEHFILTSGSPVKIPPQRIPVQYQQVEKQIQEMPDQGIITKSSSPCMAPVVSVPKKPGNTCICVDYHGLNKKSIKDAYHFLILIKSMTTYCIYVYNFLQVKFAKWLLAVTCACR